MELGGVDDGKIETRELFFYVCKELIRSIDDVIVACYSLH